jgi:hypothetical protein
MPKTITLSLLATTVLLLAGCASATSPGSDSATTSSTVGTAASAAPAAAAALDANQIMAQLSTLVPEAHEILVLTAATDPNRLLGRPNEYTSDVRFADSRVPASDSAGDKLGDVDFGGSIEVFPTAADARARARYIQAVTAALPMASEYDYVQGDVLIRVSHYLMPADAAQYEAALKRIVN